MGWMSMDEVLHLLRTRLGVFFFSSRRRHTILQGDWSSDVCSSDLPAAVPADLGRLPPGQGHAHREVQGHAAGLQRRLTPGPVPMKKQPADAGCWLSGIGRPHGQLVAVRIGEVDRKSTRLNSSHLVISYAVFCLQKNRQ